MQVTKNEKIVKVVQEETYDIKGLTKAQAIALFAVIGRTNGKLLYDVYLELKVQLTDKLYLGDFLETNTGEHEILNVKAIEHRINVLAQE